MEPLPAVCLEAPASEWKKKILEKFVTKVKQDNAGHMYTNMPIHTKRLVHTHFQFMLTWNAICWGENEASKTVQSNSFVTKQSVWVFYQYSRGKLFPDYLKCRKSLCKVRQKPGFDKLNRDKYSLHSCSSAPLLHWWSVFALTAHLQTSLLSAHPGSSSKVHSSNFILSPLKCCTAEMPVLHCQFKLRQRRSWQRLNKLKLTFNPHLST